MKADEMGVECSTHEVKNIFSISVGKPEGKRPLARPRRRWEDIRIDFKEIVREAMGCIHLAQDTDQSHVVMNTVIKLKFP
jgi:hypothetical protein